MAHRLIVNATSQHVDHRNADGLDNRDENLRECSAQENLQNQRGKSSAGFKGVYQTRNCASYYVRIRVDGRNLHLGSYPTAEEAADVYDAAALRHFGEFALTNQMIREVGL